MRICKVFVYEKLLNTAEKCAFLPGAVHTATTHSRVVVPRRIGQAIQPISSTAKGGSLDLEQVILRYSYSPTRMDNSKRGDSKCYNDVEKLEPCDMGM
jgi:hypothetical protein